MPSVRHMFGRDKPSLTALVHGGKPPDQRRRALALQDLLHPRLAGVQAGGAATLPGNGGSVFFPMRTAWRVALSVLPILALALVWAFGGFAGCRASPALLRFGEQINTNMSVNAGWPCALLLKTASPTIDTLEVVVPPQRGRVTLRGRTSVIYQADESFRGTDTFALSARRAPSIGVDAALLRVQVNVQ